MTSASDERERAEEIEATGGPLPVEGRARPAPDVRWLGAVSVLGVFAAWYLVTAFALVPPVLLPGPGAVLAAFIDIAAHGYRDTTLWEDGAATLWRCGAGFVLACLTGIPLGLAMGHNATTRAAVDYIVQFMRPLPPLSYLILLILWLGTGDASISRPFPSSPRAPWPGCARPSSSASRRRAPSAPRSGTSSAT